MYTFSKMLEANVKALGYLEESFELIKHERNWVQGYYDLYRYKLFFGIGKRYCSVGALQKDDHKKDSEALNIARWALDEAGLKSSGYRHLSIMAFNDSHSHKEVIAVWKEAIAQLRDKVERLAEKEVLELAAAAEAVERERIQRNRRANLLRKQQEEELGEIIEKGFSVLDIEVDHGGLKDYE